MILHINTKDQKVIRVSLRRVQQAHRKQAQGKLIKSLSAKNKYGSQVLLPLISKLLDRKKMIFKDLEGIAVESGPGSFTGLRVGVSVANALGYALNIPVNGKKMETDLVY